MIVVRFAVCSERGRKPTTRVVCDTREEAAQNLARIKRQEQSDPEDDYWIAELGPECEAWRWLGVEDARDESPPG